MIGKIKSPLKLPVMHKVRADDDNKDLAEILKSLVIAQRQTNMLLTRTLQIQQIKAHGSSFGSQICSLQNPAHNDTNPLDRKDPFISNSKKIQDQITSELKDNNTSKFQKKDRLSQNNDGQGKIVYKKLQQMIDKLDGFLDHFSSSVEQNIHQKQHRKDIQIDGLKSLNRPQLIGQSSLKDISIQRKKQRYNVVSDVLSYSDRREFKIKIGLQDIAKNISLLKSFTDLDLETVTAEWIGEVYRMVASVCWNMMLNQVLNFDETKILFTENIIYNYIQFMKELNQRGFTQQKIRLTKIINDKSIEILQFLGKQYPQTKIENPNIRLRQILPNINNSKRIKYDIVAIASRNGLKIKFDSNENYAGPVMKLINFMIDETNKQYASYEQQCQELFEQIYLLPSKRKRAIMAENNQNSKQRSVDEGQYQHVHQKTEDVIYKEKVKKYTKFIIGRKIDKNVQRFSNTEIQNGAFTPKSPSILRILTKWVQELIDIVNNPFQHIFSADIELKTHDGDFSNLFSSVRKVVCEQIIKKRGKMFEKMNRIWEQCFQMESKLSGEIFTHDSTQTHLSADQIQVGKFSANLQKAIFSYMFLQLSTMLHFLLEIPLLIDEKNIGISNEIHQTQIRSQLDSLNLISLRVFDLLRCKCISNEQQIIWLVNQLKERHNKDQFKIARVKNRLNQGTRDINCNIRFEKNQFLSEMQLSIVSNIQKKQEMLDKYNHFIYQLRRSKLGPLSQNVSIWTVLQQKSLYFNTISRKELPQKMKNHQDCLKQNLQKYTYPICCDSCNNYYPSPQTCISNYECKKCGKNFCGECYVRGMTNTQVTKNIFENLFKASFLKIVTLHTDDSLPLKGIFIRKDQKRKEIKFFTILLKRRNIQKSFITHQSIQQMKKQAFQEIIDCQIICVQNMIRSNKIIAAQKGRQAFLGKLCGGKLTVEKNDYFKRYYIFQLGTFAQQAHKWEKLTLKELQKNLNKEENYKIKVLNLIEQPVYVDTISFLKKKSEISRQLKRLETLVPSEQTKILIFHYQNVLILAKTYTVSEKIAVSINYSNNIEALINCAKTEKQSISFEHKQLCEQLNNLQQEIKPQLNSFLQHNIKKMYLNYNDLISLKGLKKFIQLQVLFLRHNKITSLDGVENMKKLITFRFDDNQVTDIQAAAQLCSLKRLMGVKNNIQSIDALKGLKQLRVIELQQNNISNLDPIKDLEFLEQINFKKNKGITKLPKFVSKFLKYVSVSDTSLNAEQLSKLGEYPLQKLFIANLDLVQIPDFIKKLSLKELWISDNKISDASVLQGITQLAILSIQNNKLEAVDCFRNLLNLKTVYLGNNELKNLNGLNSIIDSMKFLSIKNNPLNDCSIIALKDRNLKLIYSQQRMTEQCKQQMNDILINKASTSSEEED